MRLIVIHNTVKILFSLIAFMTSKTMSQANEDRTRYIAVHPDAFDLVNIISVSAAPKNLLKVKKLSFTALNLTPQEFNILKSKITSANGLLAPNNAIAIDDIISINDFASATEHSLFDSSALNVQFLNTSPRCEQPLNNVDFVVINAAGFKGISEFDNVQIISGPNFVNSTQECNTQATQINSLLVGKTFGVVPFGNRRLYEIVSYKCDGYGSSENVILGIHAAINFALVNASQGRRTVVHVAGVRGMNAAVDVAIASMELAGIPAFSGAGNSGVSICKYFPTLNAGRLFTIGSTTTPGDVPAKFTSFGTPCVDLFLPGDPLVTVQGNTSSAVNVRSTVYSAAIAAALGALELQLDPQATTTEVYSRLSSAPRTQSVTPVASPFFHESLTVMLKDSACPYNRLFNPYTTVKASWNKLSNWYDATTQGVFCVRFVASSPGFPILIGLRDNATNSDVVKITIDKRDAKPNSYTHTLMFNDIVVAYKKTKNKILQNNIPKLITIRTQGSSVAVDYTGLQNHQPIPLLFGCTNKRLQEVAFTSIGGKAKFSAVKCSA